jgi:hypothetical protein
MCASGKRDERSVGLRMRSNGCGGGSGGGRRMRSNGCGGGSGGVRSRGGGCGSCGGRGS